MTSKQKEKTQLPAVITPNGIDAGDVVYLKSGSARMTVVRIEKPKDDEGTSMIACCVFSSYGSYSIHHVRIPVVALKPA